MDTLKKQEGFKSQKLIVLPEDIVSECSSNILSHNAYITDIGFFPDARLHYRERVDELNSYIIIYCANGEGFYSISGSDIETLHKGSLVVIPPNIPHFYGANDQDPWTIYWFHALGSSVDAYMSQFHHKNAITLNFDMSAKFIELFEECYNTLEKGYIQNNLIYASKILEHILGVIYYSANYSLSSSSSKTNTAIEKSIQYMNENIFSNITLAELCKITSFSVPHYLKIFKKFTGYSPIDYFLRLKIQSSCKYLDLTDYSVKEISEMFNFTDPYYYSRLFKKVMNKSPKEYRKMVKG